MEKQKVSKEAFDLMHEAFTRGCKSEDLYDLYVVSAGMVGEPEDIDSYLFEQWFNDNYVIEKIPRSLKKLAEKHLKEESEKRLRAYLEREELERKLKGK